MMRWVLLTLILVLPSIAKAQDVVNTVPPECRMLPDHKPSADVAYKPGVDVHGNPVVPADVNATPFEGANQTVVVPLTVDLAKRMHQAPQGAELEGNLGYLEIHPDGRVVYNGQDWTNQVYVLCGKQPVSGNGQPPQDVIKYPPAKPPEAVKSAPPAKPKTKPQAPVAPVPPPAPKQGELLEGGEAGQEGTE